MHQSNAMNPCGYQFNIIFYAYIYEYAVLITKLISAHIYAFETLHT